MTQVQPGTGVRNRYLAGMLLAAVAAAAVGLPLTPAWQGVNFWWLDQVTRWRAASQAADPDIVVVAIDEYSIRAMQDIAGSWPWPRSVHAELVDGLKAAGAGAVVFDVGITEPDRFRPDHDAYFGEVLDRHEHVFLPVWLHRTTEPELAPRAADYPASVGLDAAPSADPDARLDIALPAVGSPENWQVGAINFVPDPDGRGRSYPLYLKADGPADGSANGQARGWRLPSLPARVIADLGLPLPEVGEIRLDWRAATDPAYTTHAYADLYAALRGGGLDVEAFAGRWVLVGATATGLHDLRATPIDPYYPGVYILANALDNLKNGDRLRSAPGAIDSVLALGLVGVAALASRRRWRLLPLLGGLGVGSAALLASSYLAGQRGLLLPVFAVLVWGWLLFLGAAVVQYWQEYQARRRALDLFGRFLDPNVVNQLADRGLVENSLMTREGEISVLFSDVRGFTTLSETRSADEIMTLLNDYFGRQVDVIFRNRGTLDKFIGDAVMAFWGAPVATADHARQAVSAGLEMLEAVDEFKRETGLADFEIGIGIHSGSAVVGMLGSERRYDYTAIGDTVNLASRIEGLTKGRARMLVSGATRDACGDSIDFHPRGCYTVKGRSAEVAVFEPVAKRL